MNVIKLEPKVEKLPINWQIWWQYYNEMKACSDVRWKAHREALDREREYNRYGGEHRLRQLVEARKRSLRCFEDCARATKSLCDYSNKGGDDKSNDTDCTVIKFIPNN